MPDQDQIQESPERHQKLQHLHDLMVDQAIKALETEEQPNASMLQTCLEVLKANDVDMNALEEKTPQSPLSWLWGLYPPWPMARGSILGASMTTAAV